MVDGNSHRDNVKDVVKPILDAYMMNNDDIYETSCSIADAVFDALGITEDEQDNIGGYFMLRAGKRCVGQTIPYDESGEFNETVLTSQAKESDYRESSPDEINAYTKRTKELKDGAKYTSSEFKAYSVGKKREDSGGWYVTLQTPICKYGQAYDGDVTLEEAKTNFVNAYYNMYLDDYERSTGEVD